jgi:glycosyltransferase involved in cell wall biosynthesis
LEHLNWIPWAPYRELADWIDHADVCLGIFGDSDKASRVIPNKVFQILAMGKPLITRDSPAIRELLAADMPGVYLIPPADPEALVGAIRKFRSERDSLKDIILHNAVLNRIKPIFIGKHLIELARSIR